MRFKGVLWAFIFIIFASVAALLMFVQSKNFGRLATKLISDITSRRADLTVSVKDVKFSVFPPGLEFNKVSFYKEISKDESVGAEFGKLGFYISLIEFEEKKLTFGEIRIADSVIDVKFKESNEELNEIDQKIIDQVFEAIDSSPVHVDTVLVENSHIFANHDLIDVRRAKVFKNGKNYMARVHLSNLKPSAKDPFVLDEVWADAEIGKKDILIQKLRVQHDVHSISVSGKIKNYPRLKKALVEISGDAFVSIKSIKDNLKLPEIIKLETGFVSTSFNLKLKKEQMSGAAEIEINDLRSSVAVADKVVGSVRIDSNKIIFDSLKVDYLNQKANLLASVEVADINNKKYLHNTIHAKVENLDLFNAIRILGPDFKILKGSLNGEVFINYQKGNIFFKPRNGFIVNDFGLVTGEESNPFEIIKVKNVKLKDTEFMVINNEFKMDLNAELPKSSLSVSGGVGKNGIKFLATNTTVDLEDFGGIAGLGVKGAGNLDVRVSGSLKDAKINFKGYTKGFEILGYKIGDADQDLTLALKDNTVLINRVTSKFGITSMVGTGFVNYKNADISLSIQSPETNFVDISQIMNPLISKMDFLPKDFDFRASIDAQISGKTRLDQLKIKTDIKFKDLVGYGENVNSGTFNLDFENQIVKIANFLGNKGDGIIDGFFDFSMIKRTVRTKFKWDNIEFSDFNFPRRWNINFNGMVSGNLMGEGPVNTYSLDFNSRVVNTRAQSFHFQDSVVAMKVQPGRYLGEAKLLGDIIEAKFDYNFDPSKVTKLKLDVDTKEVKPFIVAFLGKHLESEDITGELKFKVDTAFSNRFSDFDLFGFVEKLKFHHEGFNIDYFSNDPQFSVEGGRIKKWLFDIRQPDLFFTAKGSGKFGDNFSIIHELYVNSKIADILLAQILSAEGFVRNLIKVEGRGNDIDISATSRGTNLNLAIDNLPVLLNNFNYSLDYSRGRLVLQELKTNLDNGTLLMRGDVFFDSNEPDINLKYVLDKAEIPIMGKSFMNISGEGILLGNSAPYNLSGQITVNKAQVLNEITDFTSKSKAISQIKFLPKDQESPFIKMINLNLAVRADNPIRISNSLMDVAFKGELTLLGNPARPRGDGHLYSPANSSRVFFKNNEYLITNADINFSPKKDIMNPDFDIQATTFISTYRVGAKAYGDLERFSFDLTSDPALPRNSILSLIALGYTDDSQRVLDQKNQSSLNQAAMGSFVFDRFKVSDILNKQFGLQVNLGAVIEQSQTDSLLSGKGQDAQGGGLGRTRSATKIELKKRLDEATTLAVSSTVGGTIGQRQSMNLNYSLGKKVQLEGVYELKSNAEGEEDRIDTSIGADVKFRWTFK